MKTIQRQKILKQLGALSKEERDGLFKEAEQNCNVAIPVIKSNSSLFDSCNDETVYTVEVTNQVITDFQKLRKTENEDIRKILSALINYYSTYDNLNLILTHDVLASRQSYTRYTAQLAQFLRTNQRNYKLIKVQFDNTTTRLGIFCRKEMEASSLNTSFIGQIAAMLKVYGSAQVPISDIPLSYFENRAAIKHLLFHKLGTKPKLKWTQENLLIFK